VSVLGFLVYDNGTRKASYSRCVFPYCCDIFSDIEKVTLLEFFPYLYRNSCTSIQCVDGLKGGLFLGFLIKGQEYDGRIHSSCMADFRAGECYDSALLNGVIDGSLFARSVVGNYLSVVDRTGAVVRNFKGDFKNEVVGNLAVFETDKAFILMSCWSNGFEVAFGRLRVAFVKLLAKLFGENDQVLRRSVDYHQEYSDEIEIYEIECLIEEYWRYSSGCMGLRATREQEPKTLGRLGEKYWFSEYWFSDQGPLSTINDDATMYFGSQMM